MKRAQGFLRVLMSACVDAAFADDDNCAARAPGQLAVSQIDLALKEEEVKHFISALLKTA